MAYNKKERRIKVINYYIEDSVFPLKRKPILIRQRNHALIERYDYNSHSWVEDGEMLQIYTGDLDCLPITEDEIKEIIANDRAGKKDL